MNPPLADLAHLAGSLAPALNEPLTVILGRADALLESPTLEPPARAAAGEIYAAAEKAAALLRQVRACGDASLLETAPLDLRALVEEHAATLRHGAGGRIELNFELASSLPPAAGQPEALETVLLALVHNAVEAQPAGGEVRVSTAVTPAGDFLILAVADRGPGVPPEIRPRIFDPFFTTKPGIRHLGLGLTAAQAIAHRHRGRIELESPPGAGATFRLFLPVATCAAAPPADTGRAGCGEAVLLVDDDTPTRETLAAVLARAGYRVLQAGSLRAALEVWRWHRDRIRLLFSDIVLDDCGGGLELAAQLRAEKPALAVVFSSGHGRSILSHANPPPGTVFLEKPCRPQALLRAVRTVLDATPP